MSKGDIIITIKIIENENRCKIFTYIVNNPATTFSQIMRKLRLTKRGLGYHIENLIAEGMIISKNNGIFKHYFIAGTKDFPVLLTPMQQQIVNLLETEPLTLEDISETLGKSKRGIMYHVENLVKMNVILGHDENEKWFLER